VKLALKVDVDTYQGTLEGIPRLLELFARESVRATFFFSLGPDNTGKAIKRVFRKGFVRKVLSASPAASYGLRTMLYGTLLPAPDIGSKPAAVARMRDVKAAGHEVGIHAWDHVDWHDRLPRMSRDEVRQIVARAHARFAEVFGERAVLSAAPGWTATPLSVEAQEDEGVRVTSDTRGGEPFRPLRADGTSSSVVEVPSTLPTLDELLALEEFAGARRDGTVARLAAEVGRAAGPSVHSIHTEIEGGRALHALFVRQLVAWKGAGVRFATVGELAAACVSEALPCKALRFTTLPGRATPVATAA